MGAFFLTSALPSCDKISHSLLSLVYNVYGGGGGCEANAIKV